MRVQFTLGRMFRLVFVVALLCSLFASLKWPRAMVVLAGIDGAASVGFVITRRRRLAALAGLTMFLLMLSLMLTDWSLSSLQPGVRVSWPSLAAASASQLAMIVCWFLSVPPPSMPEN